MTINNAIVAEIILIHTSDARGICGSLTLRITLENLQNYDGNGNGKVTEQNN